MTPLFRRALIRELTLEAIENHNCHRLYTIHDKVDRLFQQRTNWAALIDAGREPVVQGEVRQALQYHKTHGRIHSENQTWHMMENAT